MEPMVIQNLHLAAGRPCQENQPEGYLPDSKGNPGPRMGPCDWAQWQGKQYTATARDCAEVDFKSMDLLRTRTQQREVQLGGSVPGCLR